MSKKIKLIYFCFPKTTSLNTETVVRYIMSVCHITTRQYEITACITTIERKIVRVLITPNGLEKYDTYINGLKHYMNNNQITTEIFNKKSWDY